MKPTTQMKTILALCSVILGLFGCNSDKKLAAVIEQLHSQNDSLRIGALESLEKYNLSLNQQVMLLEKAKDAYPKAKYDWESIPGKIVEIATKNPDVSLVNIIKVNFKDYDTIAKNASLRFLANFDNPSSIQTYKELILQYPSDISFLTMGILNKNFTYKNILFPDLLQVVDNSTIDSDILLLFLTYINNKQLEAKDFSKYGDKLVVLSKKYRSIIEARLALHIDVWEDGEYQNARFKAGIIEDILGHFTNEGIVPELSSYLKIQDNRLKMYAAISLIRLGQNLDSKTFEEIAADPEPRKWLFDNLQELNKANLFPSTYKTQEAFAESDMINWLLFPTELGRMPDAIESMKIVKVPSNTDDGMVEFYLFRFRSNHKDWIDHGWMAGVSGYYPVKNKPTTSSHGFTFSSFEKWDDKTPDQHVKDIRNLLQESYNRQK